ncbi:protein trichome birefringence-like 34 [Rhodamnia argentea]|uniref:Protein trichome birefringence-like 34 n=1 Tax=Rhodamnia argentea TaxID=178133 RepID=A0A8B8PRA2_9MYRT|nr:protein trichome birefringence-like 34 [Rhodamnia argentea]
MRHQRIKPNQMARTARTEAKWWGLRSIFPSLVALLVGTIILAAVYPAHNGEEQSSILPVGDRESLLSEPTIMAPPLSLTLSSCDVFSGRWVFDNSSRPLYKEGECKYMRQLSCRKHGRKDSKYQQWRWQPHGCDLPRFDATALLERLRNKRLMFVGDSLNRGQWVSLVCMVKSSIPKKRRSHTGRGHGIPLIVFNALDYNATIEFYWAPLLVESNCDDPVNHRIDDRIVRVRAIEKHARHWSDVDILVFNSYLWWRQGPKIKVSWGSSASPDRKYEMMKMHRAYKIALNTWSDWIQVHVNRSKTQVFFVGMSPTHERAEEWGGIAGHNCFEETEPITKEGYRGSGSNWRIMPVLRKAINKLRKRGLNAHVLNITQLSEYRKDAHTSIHKQQSKSLTRHQIANPATYADCFHWCLPGLPDVWNELLYAYILHN